MDRDAPFTAELQRIPKVLYTTSLSNEQSRHVSGLHGHGPMSRTTTCDYTMSLYVVIK